MGWAKQAMAEPEEGEGGLLMALKEHLPVMGKVAMALIGDGARVGDILEEVARAAGATQDPPVDAKPWLLGLVRAGCAKHLSKLPLKTAPMPAVASAEAAARSALALLRPTEREAVVLSVIGRLGPKDLAVACNVDEATARARLSRGLEQMVMAEGAGK